MSGKHAKRRVSKRDLRGTFTGIGDLVKTLDGKRHGVIVGWDMRDPRAVVFYVSEVAK